MPSGARRAVNLEGIELAPASTLAPDELAALFNLAYSGYFTPVALNAESFAAMNAMHDVDLARSTVARVHGAPAGIVLLAVRGRRGWIGGMGVGPEARGRGLGRELMRAALRTAWESGLTAVELEVIEENRWAIDVYRGLGFVDRRRLEVWMRAPAPLPEEGPTARVERVDPKDWLATRARRRAPRLPWQRDVTVVGRLPIEVFAIATGPPDATYPGAGIALRADGARAGILDLASAAGMPPGSLEAVLRAALLAHPEAAFSALNFDERDPARGAFERLGFQARFRQREMIKRRR